MEFENATEAWAAVKKYCDKYPDITAQCQFGQLCIIHPDNATPSGLTFYVLGFNGNGKSSIKNGKEALFPRFINVCKKAAETLGTDYFIMTERCPWGSPRVGKLQELVNSKMIRETMKLNAQANRALFLEYPPLVVWVLGVNGYVNETIEDYDLTEIDYSRSKKGTLWRHFKNTDDVPFLFSKHPTGSWGLTRGDLACIYKKLADLGRGRRTSE